MRNEVHDAYAQWIAAQPWSCWCVLTFRSRVRKTAATNRFDRWIKAIERKLKLQLTWVRVVEEGKVDKQLHLHVLLGGVPATEEIRRQVEAMWTHGVAQIRKFDQRKREQGINYILKTIQFGAVDPIDVMFHSEGQRAQPSAATVPSASGQVSESAATQPPVGNIGVETVTIPSVTFRKGSGFYAGLHLEHLVLVLPLTAPRPSRCSGITNIIASSGGHRATLAELNGRPILVNAMAMVNPNGPAWKQRASALLAKWQGKLTAGL